MRKFYLWIALITGAMNASAQTISHNVVASNGGSFVSANCQLSFTIGETITPTFASSDNILTQGFQQINPLIGTENLVGSEISTFEAHAEYNTTKLLWVTNMGPKTDFIALERMNNATGKFETFEVQNVVHNKADLINYAFVDNEPQDGDNLYRVKQILLDGQTKYSPDRKVSFLRSDKVSVFPNPADDNINVDLSSYEGKDVTVYILSELGQLKLTRKIENVGKQPINIALDDLQTGHYRVRIEADGKSQNIMKQLIISK